MQLSPKQVPEYRKLLLQQQSGICPLCGAKIASTQAALDHDHGTGHVRSTLHRNCNSLEGRILSFAKRSGVPPKEFLQSLLEYWEKDYTGNPLHPNHTSETEKLLRKYRKKIKTAKRETTKQKYKNLIKELKASVSQE